MAGIERTVALGLMSYVDETGKHRNAQLGATVRVHPDHIARFDRLNVVPGRPPEPEPKSESEPVSEPAAPKSRARARKED